MKKVSLFLIILIALMGASSFAKIYTLDECIDMAKRTDPTLERFRNSVKTAGADIWYATGRFLPSASFSGSYSKTKRSVTTETVNDLGGGIVQVIPPQPAAEYKGYGSGFTVNYSIFNGLKDVWNYLASKSSKNASELNFSQAESNLEYAVKGTYYLVLKSKRDYEVAQETVLRSEELLKLFDEKYALGSASLSEVLKQKVQTGQDKLTLIRARNNMNVAKAGLALSIGLNPNEEFDISDLSISKESLEPLNDILSKTMSSHPSILAASDDEKSAKYGVRSSLGNYLPRLDMQYSYRWSTDTFDKIKKFGKLDYSSSIWVGMSFTIFDGFSRKANLTRAKASYNNAKAQTFYKKNEIIKGIKDAYVGVSLAEETLVVTEETEKSASEDMDLVQTKYNLGAAALWELLDAQVSLKTAQFNKVKAEFDYNLAVAKLQNAMGK